MALVSCENLGDQLIVWLANASAAEKAALCAALNCGPDVDDILSQLKTCAGLDLTAGTQLVTCAGLADVLDGLLADFFSGGQPGDVWMKNPDGSYGWGNPNVAPDAVAVQYVSSTQGSDSNPGTQAQPLRTIAAALARIPVGNAGTFEVLLRSGETFVVNSDATASGTVNFYVYDDPKYGTSRNAAPYYPGTANDFQRATIRFERYAADGFTQTNPKLSVEGNLDFNGITVISASLPSPAAQERGGEANVIGNRVQFRGCHLQCRGRKLATGTKVGLDNCSIEYTGGKLLSTFNGLTVVSNFLGDYAGSTGQPAYTARADTIRTSSTLDQLADVSYDASTKSVFGLVLNWDPF